MRCAVVIRGMSTPFVVEVISRTAEALVVVFPMAIETVFAPVPPRTIVFEVLTLALFPIAVAFVKAAVVASAFFPIKVLLFPMSFV